MFPSSFGLKLSKTLLKGIFMSFYRFNCSFLGYGLLLSDTLYLLLQFFVPRSSFAESFELDFVGFD